MGLTPAPSLESVPSCIQDNVKTTRSNADVNEDTISKIENYTL
jgi:hypothetical protein